MVSSSEETVSIELNAGPIDDPEVIYDFKCNSVKYSYSEQGLIQVESEIREGCLEEISKTASFSQMAEALNNIPSSEWMWTNFDIYLAAALSESEEEINSVKVLWSNYLVHLDRWFC